MEQNKTRAYIFYAAGEILLVVIGILIALQVSSWNEESRNKKQEKEYLVELLEDFKLNEIDAKRGIMNTETRLPYIINLLEQSALENHNVPIDTLNVWYSILQFMPTYKSTDRAYFNITGSSELKLIRSKEVKYAIAQYYSRLDVLNLVQNTHEMELVQIFQPYVIEHLDFQAVNVEIINDFKLPPPINKDRILEVLHTQEFRNVLTAKFAILTDVLNQLRSINEHIKLVVQALELEINDE